MEFITLFNISCEYYLGRQKELLTEDLIIKRKKIKKGTEVLTELFPLNGRIIK